jgi:hypothetical protein
MSKQTIQEICLYFELGYDSILHIFISTPSLTKIIEVVN